MPVRLAELGLGARIALTCLVFVFAIGFAASAEHLVGHHQNRDGQSGVSLVDLEGAYHGVSAPAPLATALGRGHPEELAPGDRELLLRWLAGGRVSEDYDNLDLGAAAPAEILAKSCLACHGREQAAAGVPALEYWDDVAKVAFAREIAPVPREILAASTHTHALSLAAISAVIGGLWLATRWPARLKEGLFALGALALLVDLVSWWLARDHAWLVPLIAAAGGVYAAATGLALAGILLDLWLPRRGRDSAGAAQ
jgi:hypothetical protein